MTTYSNASLILWLGVRWHKLLPVPQFEQWQCELDPRPDWHFHGQVRVVEQKIFKYPNYIHCTVEDRYFRRAHAEDLQEEGDPEITQSIDRMLSFFSFSLAFGIDRRVCPPPPLWFRGEGHTRLQEREWGSQFQRGDIHSGTLSRYICTLWEIQIP